MNKNPGSNPENREPSWLDEVSFATKFVVVVTLVSMVAFALFTIVEMFL